MLKNVLANWSNIFLTAIAVFFLYPFFIKTLGEEQYGVWLLITSTTGYFSLLQMGVPLANVRFVSKYFAQKDYEKLSEVVCTNLFFFSLVALVILCLGGGIALTLDKIFNIPDEFIRLTKIATFIVSLEISFRFVFEVFEGILHARQQFVFINLVRNILILIRVAATLIFVNYDSGLMSIAFILLVVAVLQSVVFFLFVRLKYQFIRFSFRYVRREILREVLGYSVFVLLFQLAARLSFQTDALILGSVVSVAAIVWFNIGNNLLIYFMEFMTGISKALMPRISESEALGSQDDIQKIYLDYSRLTFMLVIPVCLSFWLYGGDFIALWVGEQYRIVSGNVLSILTLGYLFFLVQRGIAFPIFMGTSKMKFPTILMVIAALLNLVLSIWWGKVYGINGVAWGTTIPNLIVVSGLIIYMSHVFSVNIYRYIFSSVFLPMFSALGYWGGYFFLSRYVTPDSFLKLSLCVGGSLLSYSIFLFFVILTKEEKHIFMRIVQSKTS